MTELEHKYEIKILQTDARHTFSPDLKNELKSGGMMDEKGKLKIKGVSAKMLKKMKQEYVDCPVYNDKISFIQCFICPNFQSRVMGSVLCKGDPLPNSTTSNSDTSKKSSKKKPIKKTKTKNTKQT
ncbi:MAG: hypothetical protein R1F52_05515 [Candidatus Nitrosoabyssus spongiisocia]|nr:MAG: hypothetical protein R1F52_05515 [Nitrosopumilaceae archaeon AB1(1)]